MAAYDIDALLAVEVEGQKREIKDGQTRQLLPDLDIGDAKQAKVLAVLKRALRTADTDDVVGALRLALKALDLDPEHAQANLIVGLMLDRMNRLAQAIEFYERALRAAPTDPNVYYNLGLTAWKLDMLDGAERFFRVTLDLQPSFDEATINLAGVLRDRARFEDSVELLRAAIYLKPENTFFWNSLGTTLLDSGDPHQAETFYLEALRLNPEFARGWHNLGYARGLLGDADASVIASDKALLTPQSPQDRAEMIYSRAMSLLGCSRLREGWEDYAVRLEKEYVRGTVFLTQKPRWDDVTSLAGQRLLLIGEQGVGDEVLFLNVVRDLVDEIGPDGALIVACDKRLAAMVRRAHPSVSTEPYATKQIGERAYRGLPSMTDWSHIDQWTPMAAPLARYRASLDAFPDDKAYLTPDPDRVEEMRQALAKLPEGLKVGMCWKSKIMDTKRSKYFAPFEDWRPALETPGTVFVSLQYGDVDEEIAQAAKDYGVTIHQIPGLDLMHDLEGVAALGAALDVSLGPLNASTNLAAAVGSPVWFIALKTDWVFLGTDHVPWYPSARVLWSDTYGDWKSVYQRIAGDLANFEPVRRAA